MMTESAQSCASLTLADIVGNAHKDGTLGAAIRCDIRKTFHRLLPREMPRNLTFGGIRYRLDYGDTVDRNLIKRGHWEPEQIVFLFNEARRRGARVFFDIGANFGYYSLLAARLGIFDEIHAFEPHPETYKRLLWHINANKLDGAITPHNVAASDAARDMQMNIAKDGNSGGRRVFTNPALPAGDNAPSGTVTVKTLPMDSMFSFHGRNICAKIDVEGHEMAVFNGAHKLLANNSALLQVECFPEQAGGISTLILRGLSVIHYLGHDFYFVNDDKKC